MKQAITAILIVLLALCAPAGAAAKDPLASFDKEVTKLRAALKDKDPDATVKALNQTLTQAWKRLPFAVINVHLLAAPLSGHGNYIPRVDNIYRPSEPLIVYMEPVGFKVRWDKKKKIYVFHLAADFNLVDAWGRVVSGRRNFGVFEGETRNFPSYYPLSFTYSLSGLPPGDYRLETVLHDRLGKKSLPVSLAVKIQGH